MIASRTVVKSRLPQIIGRSETTAPALIEATAKSLAQQIQDTAPRGQTGLLDDNAEARKHDDTEWGVYLRFYWPFIEHGTAHHPAQPFIGPAVDGARGPFLGALGRLWW